MKTEKVQKELPSKLDTAASVTKFISQ